jgi:hypothetical protein
MPYTWMLLDGGGETSTDINVNEIYMSYGEVGSVTINIVAGSGSISSYGYELVLNSSSFTGSLITCGSSVLVSGLTPGAEYKVQARAFSGPNKTGDTGTMIARVFTLPKLSTAGGILETTKQKEIDSTTTTGTVTKIYSGAYDDGSGTSEGTPYLDPNAYSTNQAFNTASYNAVNQTLSATDVSQTTKSLFKLSNNSKDKNQYSVAYKGFTNLNTSNQYYAFGTSMFFESNAEKPNQSGGFGFFVDGMGADGYFIKIQTTSNAASRGQKEFKILKSRGGAVYELPDSQTTTLKTLSGIYGGKIYKVDVRVEATSTKRTIHTYINGFKITATDTNTTGETPSTVLPRTNKVAMMCNQGTVFFDYVYGMHLTKQQFDQENLFNVYDGQYSEATLSFLYGNKTLNNNTLSNQTVNGFIEEFGAVARELRVLKTKYENRPAFPLYASVGANTFAKIIGQRLTSFGAEVYVINNSGTFIPLDDSEYYSFYIAGKYITPSGVIEYVDNSAGKYDVQEPVIFESQWIQKNSDVVALATWIKNVWSQKQSIITMEVAGNPLLSIGDVISINYPYQQIYASGTSAKKFVVTNISHSFTEGLTTSISCRTL